MHEVFQGLPGVEVIADDILVTGYGATREKYMKDHDANLKGLLKRVRETNLKLNKKKLRLRLAEVPYMGHLLTSEEWRQFSRCQNQKTKMEYADYLVL